MTNVLHVLRAVLLPVQICGELLCFDHEREEAATTRQSSRSDFPAGTMQVCHSWLLLSRCPHAIWYQLQAIGLASWKSVSLPAAAGARSVSPCAAGNGSACHQVQCCLLKPRDSQWELQATACQQLLISPSCPADTPWPAVLQLPYACWKSPWTSRIKHVLPFYVSAGQALTSLPVAASVLCTT